MCDVRCWGYPARIDGASHQAPTLVEVIDVLQGRNGKNNFAAGGYW